MEENVTEQTLEKGKAMLELWRRVTGGMEDALDALKTYNKEFGLDREECDYLKRISNRIIVRLERNGYQYANS